MESIIQKSDTELTSKVAKYKRISKALNSFSFYSIFSSAVDSSFHPAELINNIIQLFKPELVFIVNTTLVNFQLSILGLVMAYCGYLLDSSKSNSALHIQAQIAKGDKPVGLSILSYFLIAVSMFSTAWNGVTYIKYQANKQFEIEAGINLINYKSVESNIESIKNSIKYAENELSRGTYKDDGLPFSSTTINKFTNQKNSEQIKLNEAIKKLEEIELKLKPLREKYKPVYFGLFGFRWLPQLPILLFSIFGLFFDILIYQNQRALAFVKNPVIDVESKVTSVQEPEREMIQVESDKASILSACPNNSKGAFTEQTYTAQGIQDEANVRSQELNAIGEGLESHAQKNESDKRLPFDEEKIITDLLSGKIAFNYLAIEKKYKGGTKKIKPIFKKLESQGIARLGSKGWERVSPNNEGIKKEEIKETFKTDNFSKVELVNIGAQFKNHSLNDDELLEVN